MPQFGEILSYKDYEFEDGSRADKLFVCLNVVENTDLPCLFLKTTSQSKRYEGAKRGCNPKQRVFFVPADWGKCFAQDTYTQLPQIFEISTEELLKGHFGGRIQVTSSLSSDCFMQLRNCLKQFRKDISLQHWNLIFNS